MARRERPNAQALFNKYDSYGLQQHYKQRMLEAIDNAGEAQLAGDTETLATDFAQQFSLESPILIEGAVSVAAEEAEVDVTGDWRFGSFGDGPVYTKGVRVSFYVPFAGDPELFQCSASSRNLSMRSVELHENELVFSYERPGQDLAAIKAEFDKELGYVRETLRWQQNDFHTFNISLPGLAREQIVAKKARQAELSSQINALGVPIKEPAAPTVAPAAPKVAAPPARKGSVITPEYDVALSFAGEHRDYVEKVAEGLRNAGIKVFYDKFETATLWGKNLVDHLAAIYSSRARYVVMFISQEYVEKAWTTHERQHAQGRSLVAKEEYILPARFDDTEVPGMPTTVAYQDLRRVSPEDLVKLIIAKLR